VRCARAWRDSCARPRQRSPDCIECVVLSMRGAPVGAPSCAAAGVLSRALQVTPRARGPMRAI
jgi:hypothetical protein